MKKKSLLIIGLPRSGSTEFERVCSKMLKFKKCGEILNRGFRKNKSLSYGHNAGGHHFDSMKKRFSKNLHNRVIRDVVQTKFVSNNMDWLTERFNVIYIVRPSAEISLCCKMHGWNPAITGLSKKLNSIPISDHFIHFDYYDFIFGPSNKLLVVLRKWYSNVQDFNYINASFISKRNATLSKLKRNGIKPKKNK